jgi:hypothetical protein
MRNGVRQTFPNLFMAGVGGSFGNQKRRQGCPIGGIGSKNGETCTWMAGKPTLPESGRSQPERVQRNFDRHYFVSMTNVRLPDSLKPAIGIASQENEPSTLKRQESPREYDR